jgi:hypothetical protein
VFLILRKGIQLFLLLQLLSCADLVTDQRFIVVPLWGIFKISVLLGDLTHGAEGFKEVAAETIRGRETVTLIIVIGSENQSFILL